MANDLDRWLRETVAPVMRTAGYRGGSRRFDRRGDGVVSGLQFQGSDGNVFGRLKFTLNYGAWHAGIGHMTGNDNPHGWQISRRVMGRTADVWWEVGVGADRDRTAREVLTRLSTEVLPFLDVVGTAAGFEAFWEGQPEPYRSQFLALLAQCERPNDGGHSRTLAEDIVL